MFPTSARQDDEVGIVLAHLVASRMVGDDDRATGPQQLGDPFSRAPAGSSMRSSAPAAVSGAAAGAAGASSLSFERPRRGSVACDSRRHRNRRPAHGRAVGRGFDGRVDVRAERTVGIADGDGRLPDILPVLANEDAAFLSADETPRPARRGGRLRRRGCRQPRWRRRRACRLRRQRRRPVTWRPRARGPRRARRLCAGELGLRRGLFGLGSCGAGRGRRRCNRRRGGERQRAHRSRRSWLAQQRGRPRPCACRRWPAALRRRPLARRPERPWRPDRRRPCRRSHAP